MKVSFCLCKQLLPATSHAKCVNPMQMHKNCVCNRLRLQELMSSVWILPRRYSKAASVIVAWLGCSEPYWASESHTGSQKLHLLRCCTIPYSQCAAAPSAHRRLECVQNQHRHNIVTTRYIDRTRTWKCCTPCLNTAIDNWFTIHPKEIHNSFTTFHAYLVRALYLSQSLSSNRKYLLQSSVIRQELRELSYLHQQQRMEWCHAHVVSAAMRFSRNSSPYHWSLDDSINFSLMEGGG